VSSFSLVESPQITSLRILVLSSFHYSLGKFPYKNFESIVRLILDYAESPRPPKFSPLVNAMKLLV
jgi:hypothetical protein